MKKNLFKINKGIAVLGFAFSTLFVSKAQVTVLTFTHTGAQQTFTIPACVGTMTIDVRAAQGGAGGMAGANGGAVRGIITATPGAVMYINVGGQGSVTAGGFNGGGAGGSSSSSTGAGGGGASDIRIGGNALSNRIIVAGAGGGGGGNTTYSPISGAGGSGTSFTTTGIAGFGGAAGGGCASGAVGGQYGGAAGSYGSGGGGGGLASGGGGGGQPSATTGGYGCDGTLGSGGAGGGTSYICGGATGGVNGGGGGGGGYYGGGGGMTGTGGCNGGGGGGSSYINTTLFSSVSFTGGAQTGHGIISMTYALNGAGVSASTNTNYICSGSSVTLTAGSVISYTWLPVGSFAGSNASTIIDNPTSTTSYTVLGTNSIGCISNTVLTINVNGAVPNLTVVNSAASSGGLCPLKTATITASGALSYNWTGGITNGVGFAPTSTQTYVVTGSNACGTSTAATSISIHPLPTVGAAVSVPTLCSGLSTTLTGTGNATTYTWTGGVTNGAGFAPTTTNNYTVTGTSALNCTATAVAGVTVVTTPSLTPTVNPVSICIGNASTLTATGATNYTWLPLGSFAGSNSASIAVSPTAVANTYTVIKANANCVDTKTVSVFVNQLPTIFGIATPTLVCAGKPTTLSVGGALTYTWTSPGPPTFTFTGANPVASPVVTSIYTVVGTDNNGCKNTGTVLVATDPNPTITIAATSTVLCKGQSVTLTASGGLNYLWTSTNGTVTGNTITDTPTGPTLYNVTADNSFSCTTTISQIVLVNPTPTVNIAITKTLVCTGGPSTLTATGAHSYSWDANANNALTASTIVNPTATTIYTVQGTYTTTQCQSTKTIEVKVFIPTITVTNPTNTCYGGNITLVASGANPNSYNWNTGSGFVNPFQTIAVTPTVFTIYTVSAVSASNGVNCPSTQTTSIGIFYNPTITATPQRTFVCRNESVELYGNGGVSYSWSNAQTGGTITVSPQTNTTYTVTGTDANGCVNTGTIQVKISGCVGINELNGSANNVVNVYPNPSKGIFSVSSETSLTLTLVNELGQSLRTIQLSAANQYKADISDLESGIYFLSGEKNGQPISQKLIVTK